jgi:hypothetical protein
MNTQVFDRDPQGYSRVFGVKVEAISAVFVVIIGMVAYGGPIVAGTIYLQNIYNGLEQVRVSISRLQSGPEAIAELKTRVQRIEDMQIKVVAGETGPQSVVKEQIQSIRDAIRECRVRGDDFNRRIEDLRRELDRHVGEVNNRRK